MQGCAIMLKIGNHMLKELSGDLCGQALNTLVGLEAAPAEGGGFTYTHHESGFVFEIAPIDEESEDAIMDGVQELAFNPIKMGLASKVPHSFHPLSLPSANVSWHQFCIVRPYSALLPWQTFARAGAANGEHARKIFSSTGIKGFRL